MTQQKMRRKGQPRPRPNSKQASKGGRASSRKGVKNGQHKAK